MYEVERTGIDYRIKRAEKAFSEVVGDQQPFGAQVGEADVTRPGQRMGQRNRQQQMLCVQRIQLQMGEICRALALAADVVVIQDADAKTAY